MAIALSAMFVSQAQSHNRAYGLPLPKRGEQLAHITEFAFTLKKGEKIPKRKDLSSFFAMPGDQGYYQSCTAWAIGYGIMTYDHNRAIGKKPDQRRRPAPRQVFSPGYLFTMVKRYVEPDTSCMHGVDIASTFTIASQWGNVPVSVYGYAGALGGCRDSVHLNVMDSALYRKLRTPVALFHPCPGCPRFHEGPFYPLQWQFHLSRGEPILVGLNIDSTFFWRGDSAYKAGSKHFVWDRPDTDPDGGGHALVCCGYNMADSTFLFYNSFGTEWGNNGYCWINYRTLYANCQEAFVFNGGIDESIRPRPPVAVNPGILTDSTASCKLKEGDYFRLDGMKLVLADIKASDGTSIVQFVESGSNRVLKSVKVFEGVPRSVPINDKLWTLEASCPSWFRLLFGGRAQLSAEVDKDDDEALEDRIEKHLRRFREH